jgi:hypothetical protein
MGQPARMLLALWIIFRLHFQHVRFRFKVQVIKAQAFQPTGRSTNSCHTQNRTMNTVLSEIKLKVFLWENLLHHTSFLWLLPKHTIHVFVQFGETFVGTYGHG